MQRKHVNYWYILAIGLLFVGLVLTSFFLRSPDGFLFSGEETYQHLQAIEQGSSLSAYEHVVNGLSSILSLDMAVLVLGIVLSVLLFVFFILIARQYTKSPEELYSASLITVLSTQIVLLFTGLQQITFLFVQIAFLLFIFLESEKKKRYTKTKMMLLFLLSLVFIVLIFLQAPFVGFFASAFLLFHKLAKQKTKIKRYLSALLIVVLGSLFVLKSFTQNVFSGFHIISLDSSFLFFGAIMGYSLFVFILGIGGTIITNRVKPTTSKFFLLAALILSLFYYPFLVLGVFILAFYAGISFVNLLEKKWLIAFLRPLTIILFICMFLFASMIAFRAIPLQEPTDMHVDAMKRIQEVQSFSNVTCATASNSLSDVHVEYFTKGPSYIPIMYENETISKSVLFSIQSYPLAKDILNQTNTCFVHFDDTKKTIAQLNRPPEGLELLIEYSDGFEPIFSEHGQRVYRYVG